MRTPLLGKVQLLALSVVEPCIEHVQFVQEGASGVSVVCASIVRAHITRAPVASTAVRLKAKPPMTHHMTRVVAQGKEYMVVVVPRPDLRNRRPVKAVDLVGPVLPEEVMSTQEQRPKPYNVRDACTPLQEKARP